MPGILSFVLQHAFFYNVHVLYICLTLSKCGPNHIWLLQAWDTSRCGVVTVQASDADPRAQSISGWPASPSARLMLPTSSSLCCPLLLLLLMLIPGRMHFLAALCSAFQPHHIHIHMTQSFAFVCVTYKWNHCGDCVLCSRLQCVVS